MSPRNCVPILMYHQVDDLTRPDEPMRGLVVSPDRFAAHMRLLKRLGCKGVSMAELADCWRSGKPAPRGTVGITFDDGYANNLSHALPVLQANGFSATCYVVSSLIGGSNTWDHANGVPAKPLMTREQLQVWQRAGQDIGSHSQSHANLQTLSDDDVHRELSESRAALQAAFGTQAAQHFCFPYGSYDQRAVKAAAEVGYLTATTTVRARARLTDPALELPRVLVSRTTTALTLALKILTPYEDRRDIRLR